jgi:hypothetical protein
MGTMEGHPDITLHDKPEDVEVFCRPYLTPGLSNLLNNMVSSIQLLEAFFMPPPTEVQFEDTLAIMRLSHKYDVADLRRHALVHLGTIYPTTLAGYDARPG